MTLKEILAKMQEIEQRNPLTIQQMLNCDMIEYKAEIRQQAINELNDKETN